MKRTYKKKFNGERLIYFAEVLKLAESEVADIKKKKEAEGPELDTKSLVDQANSEMDKYSAQLEEMPADFNKLLHNEILKYFLSSASRHEKDEKAGLSAKEFSDYRTSMISKTKEILADYAPTEEDIKKKKEAQKNAKETQKAAENVKPLDMKAIQENPGSIPDMQTLNSKFNEYNDWNASLQKSGMDVMSVAQSVSKSYAEYKKNRDGIGAYKKFKGYLFPENDQQRIDMQTAVDGAKTKISEALKNFAEAKEKLKKYGEALSKVSDTQKQGQIEERTKALDEVDKQAKDSEELQKSKKEQYQKLSENQKSLKEEQAKLEKHQEEVSSKKEEVSSSQKDAQAKKDSLTQFDTSVKASISRIDDALKNPELSPEEIQQLQASKKQLEEKSAEVGTGIIAADETLAGIAESASALDEQGKEAADRSLNIESHLSGQVTPTLAALDASITALEEAKLKFATTHDEINEHFDSVFKTYDDVDSSIDSAVLKNNLANEQIDGQLQKMEKSLASMDTKPPSGLTGAFEATIGVPLGMVAGGLNEAGHFLLEQATWLSNALEDSREEWTKTGLGTVGYWAARAGVEVVGGTIGVAGGLVEMGAGIVTMVAHPVDTINGLGTLAGFNPDVSAGKAWKEMGKSLISWDDFKKGHIGVGIGKLFVNIVTTVTGAGAVGAAGKGGTAVYTAARAAGKSVPKAIGKAVVAGGKEAALFVGKEIKSGAAGALETATKAPGKIAEIAKNVPGALKNTATVSAELLTKMKEMGISGTAAEVLKISKTGVEFIGTSFKSVGEGMMNVSKNLFTKEGRVNAKMQKLATTEASLATDLGKSSEKYQEYQKVLQKLREENPGLNDAQLRLKVGEQNPTMLADANKYESNLVKFEEAQTTFDKAVMDGLSESARTPEVQNMLNERKAGQKKMIDSSADYEKFRKKIAEKDPGSVKAMSDYEKAIASGDAQKIAEVKAAHPDLARVFDYFDGQSTYGKSMREIGAVQVADQIVRETASLGGKTPEEIQKHIDGLNQKYEGKFNREPGVIATLPDGKNIVVLGEDGKLKVMKKSTNTPLTGAEAENYIKNPSLMLDQYPELMANVQIKRSTLELNNMFDMLAPKKTYSVDEISRMESLIEGVESMSGKIEQNNSAIRSVIDSIEQNKSLSSDVRTQLSNMLKQSIVNIDDLEKNISRIKNNHIHALSDSFAVNSAKYIDELAEYNPKMAENLRGMDLTSSKYEVGLLRSQAASELVQYRTAEKSLTSLKSRLSKLNIEEFRAQFTGAGDQQFLAYLEGKIGEKELLRTMSPASIEEMGKMGETAKFSTVEKAKIYIQIEEKLAELRSSKMSKEEMAAQTKYLEECKEMLKDGTFSPEVSHGTNSLIWDGLASSGGEMLSGAELKRRGIVSRSGEKDIAGGLAEQDAIFCGTGPDGFGTARAYGDLNKYAEGYRSPLYYDIPTIQTNIEFYRNMIAKMDELGITEGGFSGVNRKSFARVLSDWEEALEMKTKAPHLIKDEPYQIIFGMSGDGLSIGGVPRKYGEALSGEIKVLEPKISLPDKLQVVYVPSENIADARAKLISILGPEKGSQVKIFSIESVDMMGNMRGRRNIYNKTFDATYRHLSGHTKTVKEISTLMIR